MNTVNWIKSFLNEPGTKEGSSHRLMLALLITALVVAVLYLTVTAGKFPEVPASLQDLVQYLCSILVGGIAFGKGAKAYQAIKAAGKPGEPEETLP